MLPKQNRPSHSEFDACFKGGKRYHSDYFQVIHCPASEFQVGVVVGKKVYKKAVDRNQLRRRVYALAAELWTTGVASGRFLLLVKKEAKTAPRPTLKKDLTTIIGRIPQNTVE